jgi:predicted amidohydrolase
VPRAAAIELPTLYGDAKAQLQAAHDAIERAGALDIALFAEAAFTGYVSPAGDFDLSRFAEPLEGPTTKRVRELARSHGTAIAAPLIERDGARCFNAMVVVDRDGALVGHYRKRHPWVPETWASPGDLGTPVIEVAGAKLALAICYDVNFLFDDALGELMRADALLFPSAWNEPPAYRVACEDCDTREEIFAAIASVCGISIINANWGLGAPRVCGQGRSRIVVPRGPSDLEVTFADARGLAIADIPTAG